MQALIERLKKRFKDLGLSVVDVRNGDNFVAFEFESRGDAEAAVGFFGDQWDWVDVLDIPNSGGHAFVKAEVFNPLKKLRLAA